MSLYTRLSRLLTRSVLRGDLNSVSCFTTKPVFIQLIPRRQLYMMKDTPFVGKKNLEYFHKKDGIPKKSFTLIYRTSFQNYFMTAQVFVLLSLGAFITVGISNLIEYQMTKEEQNQVLENIKEAKENRVEVEEKGRIHKEKNIEAVLKIPASTEDDEQMPTPQLSDLIVKDLDIFFMFICSLTILAATLYRILQLMPVRVYVGKKNHCVGIYYGSLVPGKSTHHEFIAGTLKNRKTFGPGVWGNSLFRDGSGKDMVLLEQFFRRQADFNYLLGIHKDVEDYEPKEGDEMSQFKESGGFDLKSYKQRKQNDSNP